MRALELLKSLRSPEHLRPLVRATLFAAGLLFVLLGLLGYVTFGPTRDYGYGYGSSAEVDVTALLVLGAVLGLAILVAAAVVLLGLREASQVLGPGGWGASARVLHVAGLVFGLGVGSYGSITLELGSRASPLLVLGLGFLGAVALTIFERGRQPVLTVLLGVGAATLPPTLRLILVGGRFAFGVDFEGVFVLALIAALSLPMVYLLVRGLLILVRGRAVLAQQPGLLSQPAPVEVLRHEGECWVRVEAPGLVDAAEVEVAAEPWEVRVRATLPSPATQGLIFSSRGSSVVAACVPLPEEVDPHPLGTTVEHGLITVRLPFAPESKDETSCN